MHSSIALYVLVWTTSLLPSGLCRAVDNDPLHHAIASHDDRSDLIYQFPNGTWVENIAPRANGRLLVSLVNTPELWEVDPTASPFPTASRLAHFNGSRQATGIAEISPDIFALGVDDSIYTIDLTQTPVNISLLATIQDTTLNGMLVLPGVAPTILVSDTSGGVIWNVNPSTGRFEISLWDETMFPVPGVRRALVGINGIRYDAKSGYVYYVNLPKEILCRVKVDETSGRATGPYEVIADGVMADDFAIAPDGSGTTYLAGLDRNVVLKVTTGGASEVVAGALNDTLVAGATSAAFGRTTADSGLLYVTTGGGSAAPVNGTYVEGGKIVALSIL